MKNKEIWKAIPGYEGSYEISDYGQVRNIRPLGRILKAWNHPKGYDAVTLSVNAVKKKFTVHHLVMLTFKGPRPPNTEVCHNNDIKKDNRLVNLRYDTKAGNRSDIIYQRGSEHSQAKLTEAKVRKIRKLVGKITTTEIARRFNVSRGAITGIIFHDNWGWLK